MTGARPPWLAKPDEAPAGPATGPRDEPTPATRRLVLDRAAGHCESCGCLLVPGRFSVHHRRPSGMGGTRAEIAHGPANLLVVCGRDNRSGCHGLIHSNPVAARDAGLLVRQGADPAVVQALIRGRLASLGADGTYHFPPTSFEEPHS